LSYPLTYRHTGINVKFAETGSLVATVGGGQRPDMSMICMLLQTNYTVLSEKDIRQRQDEATATITNFLSISPMDAGILLRHFKW
jgi:hypothetical protein